jgi:hypothetical protein
MRPMMLMSFAIVATLAIVTVGTFAATTTRPLQRATAPDAGTSPFELMVNSKNPPSPQYGEPF